jgi:hypothetical protein
MRFNAMHSIHNIIAVYSQSFYAEPDRGTFVQFSCARDDKKVNNTLVFLKINPC